MCLIAFAWNVDAQLPLVIVANRDEFHDRPAAPLGWWTDAPDILAGRDLREGGAWLGASRTGRIAAVTNVRGPDAAVRRPRSRGGLVAEFLASNESAATYAHAIEPVADEYGGFNLLLFDGETLYYAANRPQFTVSSVTPGLHGLSNAQLDTPWPKVCAARAALGAWLEEAGHDDEALFETMHDPGQAPDAELPNTGVGIEMERALSPAFIHLPTYGTRCTTLLRVKVDGTVLLAERRFDADGAISGQTVESFTAHR